MEIFDFVLGQVFFPKGNYLAEEVVVDVMPVDQIVVVMLFIPRSVVN